MRLLFLNIFLCLCISAQAQMRAVVKGSARQAATPTVLQRVTTPSVVTHVPYSRGVAECVAAQVYRQSLQASAPSISVTAPASQRSWLQQQVRNVKAWQLKRAHTAHLQTVQAQQLFEKALAALPQPQPQHSFTVPNLEGLAEVPTSIPTFPGLVRQGYLYRGLGLPADGVALRNILENGLLLQDVGPDANNLVTSWGVGRASLEEYKTLATTSVINLTSAPGYAVSFACNNAQSASRVPVVVVTQGIEESGSIVRIYADIPPAQIREVFALLTLEGTPTWCRIELDEGQFKVTPYEILPSGD